MHPQSALREWWAHLSHPATLIILVGVGAVMGVAGPFDTEAQLSLAPRLVYWLIMAVLTYGLGSLCDALLRPWLVLFSFALRVAGLAVATGFSISGAVVIVNMLAFGATFAIAAIITVGIATARRQLEAPQPRNKAPDAQVSRILTRIAHDKRGPLVALSVEDHYVRVQTTKGEDLILMRLSDAIAEVGATPGAQVHRSHWVAFDQVSAARRQGDRAILTLSNGTDIPVSRPNVSRIKEAGLLP
jgi:hypothetical protein